MPTLTFELLVAAPLAKVWAFHDDVTAGLPALSPPANDVKIESADLPARVGSRFVITANAPLRGRVRWVAKIVEHQPPHAVVFGEEARFIDEQESGPFASWRHAHEFEHVDEKTTRVTDRVTYRVPFGPVGWLADLIFVRRQVRAMFRFRHAQMKRMLES